MQHVAPCFGSEDPPGRDTLLFKCREAIESLQEEIEDYQRALISQAQEKDEQLSRYKESSSEEINNLKDKLEKNEK